MTFDIGLGVFYINQAHAGADTYETFRLPEAIVTRTSLQRDGTLRRRTYRPTFKALYASVTYTFGFGRKVRLGDEATEQPAPPSAILK